MFETSIRLREGLGRWLGGLGRKFSGKSREAKREIEREARPEPKSEAEAALWQAMGWDDEATDSAAAVAVDKAAEVLR